MGKVWDLDLPHNQLWVLMALADNASDEGYCWPGVPEIAYKTGYSERQVRYVIKQLREAGIVEQHQRPGRSSRTWLKLDRAPKKPPRTPAKTAPPSGDTPAVIAAPDPQDPCKNCSPTPAKTAGTPAIAIAGRTIKNQSVEPEEEDGGFTSSELFVAGRVKAVRGAAGLATRDIVQYFRDCMEVRGSPISEVTLRYEFQKFTNHHNRNREKQPLHKPWRGWKNAMTNWIARIRDEAELVAAGGPRPLYEDWTEQAPWEEGE